MRCCLGAAHWHNPPVVALYVVFGVLLLIAGLAAIAMVLDRFTGRSPDQTRQLRSALADNARMRLVLDDVRKASTAAITTGDPVAHEYIVERISSLRRLPAEEDDSPT